MFIKSADKDKKVGHYASSWILTLGHYILLTLIVIKIPNLFKLGSGYAGNETKEKLAAELF